MGGVGKERKSRRTIVHLSAVLHDACCAKGDGSVCVLAVADALALGHVVVYDVELVSKRSLAWTESVFQRNLLVLVSQSRVSLVTESQTLRHCMGTSSWSTS